MNLPLKSSGTITQFFIKKNLLTIESILKWIQDLPYARNQDPSDFMQVLIDERGTCSTKHALVRALAIENKMENVQLLLCIYRMNINNTSNIDVMLNTFQLPYIPEAHCYLCINGTKIDITNKDSDFCKIQTDIIEEQIIQPCEIGDYKTEYHQTYIKNWIREKSIPYSFDEIWRIRELCIKALIFNS